jgi:hypothetical protein
VRGLQVAARAQPVQVRDLGSFAGEVGSHGGERRLVDVARDEFARHADQQLLVLDQAQVDLLLRDLGVTLDGFGFALDFLVAQVPEGRNDGRQEQQHGEQRCQRGQRSCRAGDWRRHHKPNSRRASGSGAGGLSAGLR